MPWREGPPTDAELEAFFAAPPHLLEGLEVVRFLAPGSGRAAKEPGVATLTAAGGVFPRPRPDTPSALPALLVGADGEALRRYALGLALVAGRTSGCCAARSKPPGAPQWATMALQRSEVRLSLASPP